MNKVPHWAPHLRMPPDTTRPADQPVPVAEPPVLPEQIAAAPVPAADLMDRLKASLAVVAEHDRKTGQA